MLPALLPVCLLVCPSFCLRLSVCLFDHLAVCVALAAAVCSLLSQAVQILVQEYTDDTAELRRQLDSLGGMAALQEPERQLQAIMELEQAVSAVGIHSQLLQEMGFGVGVWEHPC